MSLRIELLEKETVMTDSVLTRESGPKTNLRDEHVAHTGEARDD